MRICTHFCGEKNWKWHVIQNHHHHVLLVKRRDDVALKPTFVVDDLEVVRAAAKANGGFLKPIKQAWRIRGFIVLDGCDPEGNVIQFKQVDPELQ